MYATFNTFEIKITKKQALEASHPGPCDSDVAALVAAIRPQLDKIPPADIAAELSEYGAWDETELQDHESNLARIVWIAAGNIREDLNR